MNLNDRIPSSPDGVKYRSLEEFKNIVASHYEWLAHKLKTDGDKGIKDPEKAAANHLREICDDMEIIYDESVDITDRLLTQAGVERSRLPSNPTIDDVGFEGQFTSHLKTHERRLGFPREGIRPTASVREVPEVDFATGIFQTQECSGHHELDIIGVRSRRKHHQFVIWF